MYPPNIHGCNVILWSRESKNASGYVFPLQVSRRRSLKRNKGCHNFLTLLQNSSGSSKLISLKGKGPRCDQ